MLRQALILTSRRDYAATFRQHLLAAFSPEPRVDTETDPLRAMQLSPQNYDVIFLDPIIGEMDGFQWMHVMKQRAADVKFIVVSESANEFFRFQAFQNGAALFLLRPQDEVSWEDALVQIQQVVEPQSESEGLARVPGLSLREMIAEECREKRSTIIQVDIVGNTGDIFIFSGEIHHAQCSGYSGEEAFQEIIHWPAEEMRMQVHELHHMPPRTIERSTLELLNIETGVVSEMTELSVTVAEVAPIQLPEEMAMLEAPPRILELEPDPETPAAMPSPSRWGDSFRSPGLVSHWKIDLAGNFNEGHGAIDPSHTAALTYFIYRKMADVSVALEEDYFTRLTLFGPEYRQELVADNFGVRHAIFRAAEASPDETVKFISWCYEHGV